LWGISLLKIPGFAKKILASFSGLFLAIVIVSLITFKWDYNVNFNIHKLFGNHKNDYSLNDTTNKFEKMLSHQLDSNITIASLSLDASAGGFLLKDTCSDLIQVYTFSQLSSSNLNVSNYNDSSAVSLDLTLDNIWKKNKEKRRANIMLNPKTIWNLNFDLGACTFEGDLSNYKVEDLNIDGGASSIEIKLGQIVNETNVNVDVGASSVKIQIPVGSGCEIISNTGLCNKNFHGFQKINDTWRTENFYKSDKKIHIDLSGGVSSFEVTRY